MTSPIESSRPRPAAAPPSSETQAPQAASAAAKPAAVTKAPAPDGSSAAAPTSFTQAKSEPKSKSGSDLAVPSRLSRSQSREAAPLELASAKDAAPTKQADYPVKPQAEEPLKRLNEDPRVKGDPKTQAELGKMIDSDVFRKLDANGQKQAFDLFKANLGSPDGPARAKEAVQNLAAMKSEQAANDVLTGLTKASPLTADTVNKTRDLVRSPEFANLSPADQRLVTEGLKEAKCDPKYSESMKGLMQDPKFKALKPEEQRAILERTKQFPDARTAQLFQKNLGDKAALDRAHKACDSLGSVKSTEGKMQVLEGLAKGSPISADMLDKTKALVNSPQFAALSASDQQLVTGAVSESKADPKVAESIKKLVEDPKLGTLAPAEQTALLSQVKNYPDTRSIDNLGKLINKPWFAGNMTPDDPNMSAAAKAKARTENMQRAFKTVAFLSQYEPPPGPGVDPKLSRKVIDNTLNRFLGPNAPYQFDFKEPTGAYGSAPPGSNMFHMNPKFLPADNGKVNPADHHQMELTVATMPHEVNHLVNGDSVSQTHEYFQREFRSWYMEFHAREGRNPTREEMAGIARHLFNTYPDIKAALDGKGGAAEQAKIIAYMNNLLGRTDVTPANAATLPVAPGASGPLPVPPGNLDNS